MSDIQRPRKLIPNYKQESNWRNKKLNNSATHKYTREAVLHAYHECAFPVMPLTEAILPLYSSVSLLPFIISNPNYRQELGDDINSRKPVPREKQAEQVPEWYTEGESKEGLSPETTSPTQPLTSGADEKYKTNEILNLNDMQDEFGKIDLEVEEKLKNQLEEDESIPEWDEPVEETVPMEPKQAAPVVEKTVQPQQASKLVPFYDAELLKQQLSLRNPFAKILAECAMLGSDNLAYFMPFSKPFEKFWFYKDLAKKIQGPFCTIEMFNWSVRGCFPADLEISQGNTEFFIPMNKYFSSQQPQVAEQSKETEIIANKEAELPKTEQTQQSDVKFGGAYNDMFPAFEPSKQVYNNQNKASDHSVWEEVKKTKPNTKGTRGKAK